MKKFVVTLELEATVEADTLEQARNLAMENPIESDPWVPIGLNVRKHWSNDD